MSKYFVIQGVWLTIRVRGRSGGEKYLFNICAELTRVSGGA